MLSDMHSHFRSLVVSAMFQEKGLLSFHLKGLEQFIVRILKNIINSQTQCSTVPSLVASSHLFRYMFHSSGSNALDNSSYFSSDSAINLACGKKHFNFFER